MATLMPPGAPMLSGAYLPPQYQPTLYPTASYAPVTTSYSPAPVVEAEGVAPEAEAPSAAYVAPPTYGPPLHVTDAGPFPAGGARPSYTPMPSVPYPSYSYQPPPGQASVQAVLPTYSYTPSIVDSLATTRPTAQHPSYVAPPAGPPPKLTEGMPDPSSVETQKAAYSKSIESQLRQRTKQLAEQNQASKQMLAQGVQAMKAQYNLQMDQYLQQQAMTIDQQANAEMMALQEAAMQQKMVLEQQAAGLTLEYQQRKAQEEMMAREYQIQKQYYDAEMKLAESYQKQHGIDGRMLQQPQLGLGQPQPAFVGGAASPYPPNVMQQPYPGMMPSMTYLQPSVTQVVHQPGPAYGAPPYF